jgi:predicted nucleic acid-binding protein
VDALTDTIGLLEKNREAENDFFIGAHAELLGWKLATRDVERYRIYFPAVELIEPVTVS